MQLYEGGLGSVGGSGRWCEKTAGGARVNGFAEGVELFKGDIPSAGEDVGGELAPVGGGVQVVVGGEDTEVV
jgi:hypothetical protein